MASVSPNTMTVKGEEFDEKAVVLCQFCGGASCPQENYLTNKFEPNAIEGLHSNWITEQILAMQRPSTRLIEQFRLFSKFKELNINTILNLQEAGEHPYCGDGIIPSIGFSYDPSAVYVNGLQFFNQSWEDMTATTFKQMMRVMDIFDSSIIAGSGKIAVHCHAGRGRTLLVICAWLIYQGVMTAEESINLAVTKRQGVLTRKSQRDFLYQFETELQLLWRSYLLKEQEMSLTIFVTKQSSALLKRLTKDSVALPCVHFQIMTILKKRVHTDWQKIVQALIGPSVYEGSQLLSQQPLSPLKKLADPSLKQGVKEDTIIQPISHESKQSQPRPQQPKQSKHNTQETPLLTAAVNLNELKKSLNKLNFDILVKQSTQTLVNLLIDFYEQFPCTPVTCHGLVAIKAALETNSSLNSTSNETNIKEANPKQTNIKETNIKETNFKAIKQTEQSQNGNLDNFRRLTPLLVPQVVHQLGVSTIACILDWAYFLNSVQERATQTWEQQSTKQPIETIISPQKLLQLCSLRISLLLQSKRGFNLRFFSARDPHICKLRAKSTRLAQYLNQHIWLFAELLRSVAKSAPNTTESMEDLVMKVRRIAANIEYLEAKSKAEGILSTERWAEIYKKAGQTKNDSKGVPRNQKK